MIKYLKKKLLIWLGINEIKKEIETINKNISDLVGIGIDVNICNHESYIILFSRIKGGQLRIIPTVFKNVEEINKYSRHLKEMYHIHYGCIDKPYNMRDFFIY